MPSISAPTAALIGAGVSGAASIGSSLIGGSKASGGSQQSQYLQALQMNQNIANTAPFIGAGQYGVNALQGGLQSGRFGAPMDLSGMPTAAGMPQAPAPFVWNPTMEGLAQTPGYQFTLDQGLKGVQSSAAARGLGMSGTALRGAADYATGLASKTYDQQLTNAINTYNVGLNRYQQQVQGAQVGGNLFQNQFADYWNNQLYPYKQLTDLATLGANSAAQQGTTGQLGAQAIGNAAQNAGLYQGAATANAGNALAGALNSPAVQGALQSWGSNAYGTPGNLSSYGANPSDYTVAPGLQIGTAATDTARYGNG